MIKVNESLMERALKKTKSEKSFLCVLAILISIMMCVILLNTYVFFNVQIKGPSMQPTMFTDDVLVANKLKSPTYGSIVIIAGEKDNGDWIIKRVIAMGGDTVDIRSDGYVYVKYKGTEEFVKIDEPYVKRQGITASHEWVMTTISEGEIFYLGDNRENSSDSRKSDFSTCKETFNSNWE